MRIDMEWCVCACFETRGETIGDASICYYYYHHHHLSPGRFMWRVVQSRWPSSDMADSYMLLLLFLLLLLLLLVQVLILSEHLVHIASTIDRIRTTRERRQKIVNRRRRVSAAASHSSSQMRDTSSTSRFAADDESETKATSNDIQSQGQQMEVLKENSVLHNDLIQVRNAPLLGLVCPVCEMQRISDDSGNVFAKSIT